MEQKRIPCPFCRELIVEGAQKCRFCGEQLSSTSENTISSQHQKQIPATTVNVNRGGISFGALLIGWIVAELIGLMFGYVIGIAKAKNIIPIDQANLVLLYGATPLSALVGGLVVGAISKRHFFIHGFMLGVLCIIGAIILPVVMSHGGVTLKEVVTESFKRKEILITWAITIACGVLGAFISPRRSISREFSNGSSCMPSTNKAGLAWHCIRLVIATVSGYGIVRLCNAYKITDSLESVVTSNIELLRDLPGNVQRFVSEHTMGITMALLGLITGLLALGILSRNKARRARTMFLMIICCFGYYIASHQLVYDSQGFKILGKAKLGFLDSIIWHPSEHVTFNTMKTDRPIDTGNPSSSENEISSGPNAYETAQFIKDKLHADEVDFNPDENDSFENELGNQVASRGPELQIKLKQSNGFIEQSFWFALEGISIDSIKASGSEVVIRCKNNLKRIVEFHWTGQNYESGRYSENVKLNNARLRAFSPEDADKVAKALRHLMNLAVEEEKSIF
jgi:hypothetical protein